MQFQPIDSIKSVLSRINEIQSRFQPPPPVVVTPFDFELQQAMQSQATLPGVGLPDSLAFLQGSLMTGQNAVIFQTALSRPEAIVSYQGYDMQAQTASRFIRLEQLIKESFPGRGVHITSTVNGTHSDPNHPAGKAVDFVVDGLTAEESKIVEGLCIRAGFKPYNEYIYSSTYKTGDHMHIALSP